MNLIKVGVQIISVHNYFFCLTEYQDIENIIYGRPVDISYIE